jgi:carbon storage regulator
MLVLTRKIGETIVIDGVIAVTVLANRGDKVSIGIQAPENVRVDRREIHERRLQSNPCAVAQGLENRRAAAMLLDGVNLEPNERTPGSAPSHGLVL